MTRKMGVRWHLRDLMAAKGMFMTSDLGPLLTERGVTLSREQVYRLVTQTPERLNVAVLAALCDILGCGPGDLLEPFVENAAGRKKAAAAAGQSGADIKAIRPKRARIVPDR